MSALWRLLRPLYARRAAALAGALALALLTLAAGTGLLGVSGWFLTGAALAGSTVAFNLFAPSALVRGLSFVRIASRYGERLAGHAATLDLLADLRARVFARLLPMDPRRLARLRDGDLVARLTGDVDALDTVFLLVLAPIATALLAAALLAAALAVWLPAGAWVPAAGLAGAALLVPACLARLARRPGEQAQRAAAQMRVEALQAVEGHADLLALGAAGIAAERYEQACRLSAQARMRQAALAAGGQAAAQLLAGASMLGVLLFGLDALRAGELGGPLLAGLLLAVLAAFEVAAPIVRGAARLGGAAAAAARLQALEAPGPAVAEATCPVALPAQGVLRYEGVRYGYRHDARRSGGRRGGVDADDGGVGGEGHGHGCYDAGKRDRSADGRASGDGVAAVLEDLDLTLAPGERVAIVGASGAGKSTLLHLLLRFDDPWAGSIRYGGVDLRQAALADLHAHVAVLAQDSPVFLGTVRSNLLIGDPSAGDDALWRALDAARLGGFVRGLPDGLDTWTGETGRTLSAGQARRLCLARALLSPAPLIALDEPTEGLDDEAAQAFLADLGQAAQGRAVLLVTHAALPPGAVDRVLRLEGGRLLPLA